MPRRKVRNPVAGMLLTLGETFIIGLGLCLPTFVIPVPELDFIYLGFAFLAAGVVAGRETIAGFMGFLGAFVGGAAAAGLWVSLVGATALSVSLPLPSQDLLIPLFFGVLAGVGGTITGRLAVRRVEHMADQPPDHRTCERCGSRVGLAARTCWSCKAVLRA